MGKNYSETLYQLYLNVGFAASTVYLFLFLSTIYFHKGFTGNYRYFFWLFILYGLTEQTGHISRYFELENDLFIDHISFFFGTLLKGIIYYKFVDSKIVKKFIKWFVPLCLIAIIFTAIYQEGYLSSPLLLPVVGIVFLVLYLILHRQLIQIVRSGQLRQQPVFWFNLSFTLWAVYILIFGVINEPVMQVSNNASFVLHIFGSVLDYFCLLLYFMGIWKLRKWHSKPALA